MFSAFLQQIFSYMHLLSKPVDPITVEWRGNSKIYQNNECDQKLNIVIFMNE